MPRSIINTERAFVISYKGNADIIAEHPESFKLVNPELDIKNGIPTGRLSGIVNHHVPGYLRGNQLPTYQTNCIEDWEEKLAAIVQETYTQRMGLISGIPPWVQMYFDRLETLTGKKIGELFPDFQVFVTGGVNFEPYRQKLMESIDRPIDVVETYPASEGFIAAQDSQVEKGMLLLVNNGMFYEFIPAEEIFADIEAFGNGSMLDGCINGIEENWFQSRIADSAYDLERKFNSGERIIVGVSQFLEGNDEDEIDLLRITNEDEQKQRRRLEAVRSSRNSAAVAESLAVLETEAADPEINLMPALINASNAQATVGEMMKSMGTVFGRHIEVPTI